MSMSTKLRSVFLEVRRAGRKHLLETEAKGILAEYGIPVTRFKLAKSEAEAIKAAEEIGYPVVLKIVSPDVLHKSDVGGVIVGLKDARDVERAYRQVLENVKKHKPEARVVGILVEEMVPASIEVIVGSVRDPQFGPTIMFGIGGIFVEILKDVTLRIAPISERDAREMISEIRAYPLLRGYRNLPPANVDAIVDILVKTSNLVTEYEEIKELDLNPIMVNEKGAKVVDARIILE